MTGDQKFLTLVLAVCGALLAAAFVVAVFYGIGRELDRQERTYYDKELGRMVYVEPGV